MHNYDEILNDLLKKYDLYKEFNLNLQKVIQDSIEKSIDTKKRFLVYGDLWTINYWQNYFKLINKINVVGIILDSYAGDRKKVYGIDIYSVEDIATVNCDEILICSKEEECNLPNELIIKGKNFYSYLPEYVSGFGREYLGNSIYEYISVREMAISEKLEKELNNFYKVIDGYGKNNKTVVWGAGIHTKNLFNNTDIIERINVGFIVDKNEKLIGKKINGIEIISFEKLEKIEFDSFFISSYEYRNEIVDEIKSKFSNKNIINMYNDEFTYEIISRKKLKSQILNKNIEREKIIKDLIVANLFIRDFYNAEKYIKDYINNKYSNYNKINDFYNELIQILEKIKVEIKNKKNKNINLLLIDALDKSIIQKEMKYLQEFSEKSISYENAFSPSTYTTESHLCMFAEKNLFAERLYDRKPILKDNCKFIRDIEEMGYRSYGNNIRPIVKEVFEYKIGDDNKNNPISKILWENLCCDLMEPEIDKFIFSRFMEYHDIVGGSYKRAAKHIDEQLKFYMKYFGKNDYIFITADHGSGYLQEKELKINIPLVIKTPSNECKLKRNLFSTEDIGKKIVNVIQGNYEDKHLEYIVVERTPIYNEAMRLSFELSNRARYIKGFRIIRTLTEKYIYYQDGTEEYYRIPNEEDNLILDTKYQKEIDKFRKINESMGFPEF